MRVEEATIMDVSDPLSKALDKVLRTGLPVVVVKEDKYFGIIDDKNIRRGIKDPSSVKCENAAVKAPRIMENMSLKDRLQRFLAGHFKALPVVDERDKVKGVFTRDALLSELLEEGLIPPAKVSEFMASPAYTLPYDATLGEAKRVMKEKSTHHLVITNKGKLIGIVSTFDFLMFLTKPKERQSFQLISEVKNEDMLRIGDFIREPLLLLSSTESLPSAVEKMKEKRLSYAVVTDDNKTPVGVLSTMDILKHAYKSLTSGPAILISGLSEEDMYYYNDIVDVVKKSIAKFTKSFDIPEVLIHVKKGKSVYELSATMEVDLSPLHIKASDYSLEVAVDKLVDEMDRVLRKMKDKIKGSKSPVVLEREEYL